MNRSTIAALLFLSAIAVFSSLAFCQKPGIENKDNMLAGQFFGPVHSVETTHAYGTQDIHDRKPFELYIYDRDGFEIESYRFDEETGAVAEHITTTRNRDVITKIVTDDVENKNLSTVIQVPEKKVPGGTQSESRDANGTLLTQQQRTGQDMTTQLYEKGENGDPPHVDEYKRFYTYDPATRTRTLTRTKNGKVIYRQSDQQTDTGRVTRSTHDDGSYLETIQNFDGESIQHSYDPAHQLHVYYTVDKGHQIEIRHESPKMFDRITFTYEEDTGWLSGETKFNREGEIVDRVRYDYDRDVYGNWIEQRKFASHGSNPALRWEHEETIRRIITYY